MKRISLVTLTLFALLISLATLHAPQSAFAQDSDEVGQLQGTITDSEGNPFNDNRESPKIFLFHNAEPIINDGSGYKNDAIVRGSPHEGFWMDSGGFYRIPHLKPGIYEVIVYPINPKEAPVRVLGVLVKAGEPVRLEITLHKGKKMEVQGKPLINIPPAIVVSEELEKLHKEIDDLKKQVEELKKK